MLNNYLTATNETPSYSSVTSDHTSTSSFTEELEKRAQQQQRHYEMLDKLKKMASEMPIRYQQRMPYELLSNLASCMLDDSIGQIVCGLKEIQHMQEKSLFERRQKQVEIFRAKKVEIQKKLMTDLASKVITYEKAKATEKEFNKMAEEELNKLDMKTILQLDQQVSEQQVTLERTGVPGFMVTNNPTEIKIQMYILDFIQRISERTAQK